MKRCAKACYTMLYRDNVLLLKLWIPTVPNNTKHNYRCSDRFDNSLNGKKLTNLTSWLYTIIITFTFYAFTSLLFHWTRSLTCTIAFITFCMNRICCIQSIHYIYIQLHASFLCERTLQLSSVVLIVLDTDLVKINKEMIVFNIHL